VRLLRTIAVAVAIRAMVAGAAAAALYVAVPLAFPHLAAVRSVHDIVTDIRSGLRELDRVLKDAARS
jgi:hypothetical protein